MSKNHAKINDFGTTGLPKSTRMVPRSAPKVTLEINHEKSKRITKNCEAFWRHLGDFGCHLVSSWAPRGSQNREFWHQDAPKSEKMTSKIRHLEKYEFLLDVLLENLRFLKVLNPPRCFIYKHFGGFRWLWQNREFHENLCQNLHQKWAQNRCLGDQGPTFEVLDAFLRSLIFNEFSIGKKSANNLRFFALMGGQMHFKTFRWVGSADRAGSVWGQESAEVRVKIRHALKPRSARRGRRI